MHSVERKLWIEPLSVSGFQLVQISQPMVSSWWLHADL